VNEKPKHAIFSEEQRKHVGSTIYRAVDGSAVEVTQVSENPIQSSWPDAKDVGMVTEYIQDGQPPDMLWSYST
jgi:hypothetical protein